MRMWFPRVDFQTASGISEKWWGDATVSPAGTGTNFLEYGRLSELSRDEKYVNNVFRVAIKADSRPRERGGRW